MAAGDLVGSDVDVHRFVHDLRLVQQRFHRPDSDERSKLVDLRNSAFDDFLVVHAEKNGIKLNPLVNGSVAVNDAASANGLVIVRDQDKAILGVKLPFKGVH